MKTDLRNLIKACTAEIKDIDKRITTMSAFDKEVCYLTHYALIKASGTAEFVYHSIVADHFLKLSDSRIDTYLDGEIRKGSMSAKYSKMCELLGKFDIQWKISFQNAVNARQDGRKIIEASNSLVTNRHDFAHGRPLSATFSDIKNYYSDVVKLIRIFDSVVR